MADRNVTIVLPEELIAALDQLAAEIGVSRSALIRRAALRYVPTANRMVQDSRPGNYADELFYLLAGPPVKKTGDETDELFREALASMRERLKDEKVRKKTQKKRAGRPRKSRGENDE